LVAGWISRPLECLTGLVDQTARTADHGGGAIVVEPIDGKGAVVGFTVASS